MLMVTGGTRGVLKLCRVRGGSTGMGCKPLGATPGGGNIVAGWTTAWAGGWMTMASDGLKLGGSITPLVGEPKTVGTIGAAPTGGGIGGGGYID